MLSTSEIILIIVILSALVLIVSNRLRADLVAVLVLLTLGITGVVTPAQAVSGFSRSAVITIMGLFIITHALEDTGVVQAVANRLAAPLHAKFPQVEPLEPKPEAGEGVVETRVFETHAGELAWLAEAVADAHDEKWSDIGVLTRDNAHAEDVFDALTSAGIPVEIVGLSGLLRLPEVAEIVAILHLLHDVTANAALLTLLTGPRWAVGPRDLRLLSRRAQELAGRQVRVEGTSVDDLLVAIADGIDPTEIPSLDDALADPGEAPYSPEALDRFALLSAELRMLRTHVGEPLLDTVRRIIDTTGTDVELASAVSPAAGAIRFHQRPWTCSWKGSG